MPDTSLHLTLGNSEIIIPNVSLLESGSLDRVIPNAVKNRIVANLNYNDENLPVFSFDGQEIVSDANFKGDKKYVCLKYGKVRFCVLCQHSEEINPDIGNKRSLPGCMRYTDSVIRDVLVIDNRLFLLIDMNVIKKFIKLHKKQNIRIPE